MTDEDPRSIWNVVALIATLALAAVVAVVAVTRSDRNVAGSASPSASPSPSPSPSVPGGLTGKGPYLVYAIGSGDVFAYDIAAKQWIEMGRIDGSPVAQHLRQPGPGQVAAFATDAATVWRIDREGLERIAVLPVADPRQLEGGVVSRDGRRLAVASRGPDPELIVVNLGNGRTSAYSREEGSSSRYPDESLVPVGWSLGGTLVYQVPWCECDTGSPGLYLYDLGTQRSSLVAATAQVEFLDRFGISPDGQELVWGDGDDRPYTLRRLASGRQSASIIRRDSDERFVRVIWSSDGESMLLTRMDAASRATSYELAEPESGDTLRTLSGFPERASALALLPGRIVVVLVGSDDASSIQTVVNGRVTVVTEPGQEPVFLGWLR